MTSRKKLLLVAPHLRDGGSAQVIRVLAGNLSREKYEIHLVAMTQAAADPAAIFDGVELHGFGTRRVRAGAAKLLKLVREIEPDAVFSSMVHLNFAVILMKTLFPRNTTVLLRQNAMMSAALAHGDFPWPTRLMFRTLYPCADRVICQTGAMADDVAEVTRIERERLAVVRNPIDVEAIRRAAAHEFQWRGPGPHLAAVGRLSQEKGFDLLLRAMVEIRRRYPQAELAIAGSGPLEIELKRLTTALRLVAAVRFLGQIENPYALLAGATAFVLPSRHDAMPNALLEAAALGLPLVATPASGGVVELLKAGPGTWIAGNISAEALTTALLQALGSLPAGARFAHEFLEPFRIENAVAEFERVIDEAIEAKQR